jgi:hypothetical protein
LGIFSWFGSRADPSIRPRSRAAWGASTAERPRPPGSAAAAPPAEIDAGARFLGWAAAWLGAALTMGFACLITWSALPPRLGFAIAFGVVAGEILLTGVLAPRASRALAATSLLGSGCVLVGLWGAAPGAVTGALLTAALLSGGSVLGAVIGARIERPGHLLAVAAVSGFADLWSVLDRAGPTARLVEAAARAPERLALFALPWPLWGTGSIQPTIGAGDVIFVALYLAAYQRHGLRLARALWGLGLAFAAGLLSLLALERAIPLLPLLGAAAVLADGRARRLAPGERRAVSCVVVVLLGALALRVWG